ncbi:MAG: site-specific recombinase, partial [Patescibacteria group bacterium]|nr:site-specific recombinase [Patescibacteria group bacterium]
MITQKSIIYCRVSSERQKTEGHGLDSQEHRCRELAKQKGYEVEKVFRDSFSGGGDFTKRPAMSEMLSFMDSKPYNSYVVIFDDLKRLARDTEQYLKLKRALELRRAIVECPNFVFSNSPEGQYVETIMAATAQLEREQNRRQVMQKMKARLELGYWCFPDLPAGYEFKKDPLHGKLPVFIPKTSEIIKEALEGYASGRFIEQEDVRCFLEEKRILNGKQVYLGYVSRILTNIFYAGYIEYGPWEVSKRQAKHEPLIDLATFGKIQERLNSKTRTHIRNVLNEDFPLRSFVLCSSCKKSDTASWSRARNGKMHPYYRCKTKGCPEQNKSIRKEKIEKEFEAILKKIKPSSEVLNLTRAIVADVWKKKETEGLTRKRDIEKDIEKVESEKARFMKLITRATNESVVTAYEEQISSLTEKSLVLKDSLMSFDKHRPNIETALEIVFDFLKDPLKQWQKGNIHTQKLILRLVFEENLRYNRKSGFETAILSLPL